MTATTATYTDFTRGFELLKRVYADKVEDMVPESDRLAKDIDFAPGEKSPGQDFYQPVTLTREGGVTWWNDGSVKTLNQPLSTLEASAAIRGSEIAIRSALSYKFLNTALKNLDGTRAGVRAFVNATKDRFEKLSKGASYFRECMLLYGGGVNAAGALGTVVATTGSSGTTLNVVFSASDYATAIWSGSEGVEFDIYSTGGTKRNSAGTTTDTVYKLTGNNPSTYTVTFTSHATNVSNVVAGDQIFFSGARGNDALGFIPAAQVQSGNLWGISTATYGLWRPLNVSVGGILTFERVMSGAAQLAAIGFYGTLDLYCNPATFQDVCNDQTALVSHPTQKTGKVTIGFDDVSFKSQAGTINLKAHPYMKRGLALALPREYCMRIGSTDLTHTMPGYGKMFRELENAAGVEMRLYTDQAPFCKHPSYMCLFTSITNSTD